MKSVYPLLFLVIVVALIIFAKQQVCSWERNNTATTVLTEHAALPGTVDAALNMVKAAVNTTDELAIVQALVDNELEYRTLKAKQGSVGPNLPVQDKEFLEGGYQSKQQALYAELASNGTLTQAVNELLAALNTASATIAQESPFVGGVHPDVTALFNIVIQQLN